MSKCKNFFSVKNLTLMAMFIAMQIVLARFLGIQVSEGLRLSFEAIPVILGGLWLGPVAGALIGLISDFLGFMINGFGAYFLPYALIPIVSGVLPSLIVRFIWKNDVNVFKFVITILVTQILANLVVGTYVLSWYFALFVPEKDGAFLVLLVSRIPKLLTIAGDVVITTALHFAMFRRIIQPMLAERR